MQNKREWLTDRKVLLKGVQKLVSERCHPSASIDANSSDSRSEMQSVSARVRENNETHRKSTKYDDTWNCCQNEPRQQNADQDEDGSVLGKEMQCLIESIRKLVINTVLIFAEAIQNSSKWCLIEETHRRP